MPQQLQKEWIFSDQHGEKRLDQSPDLISRKEQHATNLFTDHLIFFLRSLQVDLQSPRFVVVRSSLHPNKKERRLNRINKNMLTIKYVNLLSNCISYCTKNARNEHKYSTILFS